MQTTDNTPSELPPEAAVRSPSPTTGGSLNFGLASDRDADSTSSVVMLRSDTEETSTLAIQPRRGL